jgi:hypothetical protein
MEEEVVKWIKTIYDGEILLNSRNLINGEIDIYIPQLKLAIFHYTCIFSYI